MAESNICEPTVRASHFFVGLEEWWYSCYIVDLLPKIANNTYLAFFVGIIQKRGFGSMHAIIDCGATHSAKHI